MMKDNDIKRAYSIVADYKGKNNQINYYKILSNEDKLILHEFDVEYILRNHQYEILELNKIVKISSDLGSLLKEKYDIEFTPKVLKIIKIIGEMGQSYHCYAQYRQSVPPQLMYIPKKYILTALQDIDYKSLYINFDKYDELTESLNRKLKEHQKDAVRFMLSNKKCILADQQGLGKTTSAIVAALEGGFDKILVITTASLKSNWKKEALLYVKEDDIQVINGSQWDGSKKVTIANYDIIQNFYEVPLEPVYEEQVIGHAEVRQLFKASAVGNIAGSYILDGRFDRGCKVRISRGEEQIYEGELASLKRFKDDVKEVKAGFECGLVFEGFDQMQEGDIVEAYIMVEVPR